jgi:hypothetical protein
MMGAPDQAPHSAAPNSDSGDQPSTLLVYLEVACLTWTAILIVRCFIGVAFKGRSVTDTTISMTQGVMRAVSFVFDHAAFLVAAAAVLLLWLTSALVVWQSGRGAWHWATRFRRFATERHGGFWVG